MMNHRHHGHVSKHEAVQQQQELDKIYRHGHDHRPQSQIDSTFQPPPPTSSPGNRVWSIVQKTSNVIASAVSAQSSNNENPRQHNATNSYAFDAGSEVFMPQLNSNKFNITLL